MPPERDYPVGYGKPPVHTRFKKGQSGNPRGRAKGGKNLATLLGETLNETVTINENGRRRKISKREALAKQIVNRAAQGDAKTIQIFLRLMGQIDRARELRPPPTEYIRVGADAKP